MKKITASFVALILLLSFSLGACQPQSAATPAPQETVAPNEVVAEGRLKPAHAANLFFQARGTVEEITVKTGDAIKKGDVLARLANAGPAEAQLVVAQNAYDALLRNESGERAQLWQNYLTAQAERAKAEKKWDALKLDDIDDDIDNAKADVEDRRKDLQDAQDEFDKYKDLDKKNSKRKTAQDDLDKAQDDLNEAIRKLEEIIRKRDEIRAAYDAALAAETEAKHQYEISLNGPNAEQLALAKANLEAAKDTLANYVIIAPFDGIVAEVNVEIGQQAGPEIRVISLIDPSRWAVETTDVTELEAVKLSVGQKATIVPDALPDLTLQGVVTEISGAYTQQGGDILYKTTLQINVPDPRLRWGMTVEITFLQ